MRVARAAGAEARSRLAVVVAAADGEVVRVEVERVAVRVVGSGARGRHAGLVDDGAERVAALGLERVANRAGPAHRANFAWGDLRVAPGLDNRAVGAHQVHVDVSGRRATKPV